MKVQKIFEKVTILVITEASLKNHINEIRVIINSATLGKSNSVAISKHCFKIAQTVFKSTYVTKIG